MFKVSDAQQNVILLRTKMENQSWTNNWNKLRRPTRTIRMIRVIRYRHYLLPFRVSQIGFCSKLELFSWWTFMGRWVRVSDLYQMNYKKRSFLTDLGAGFQHLKKSELWTVFFAGINKNFSVCSTWLVLYDMNITWNLVGSLCIDILSVRNCGYLKSVKQCRGR